MLPVSTMLLAFLYAADAATAEPPVTGAPGEVVAVDTTRTRARVAGGVLSYAPGPEGGTLTVRLRGSMLGRAGKHGEVLFDLRRHPLGRLSWANRTLVSAEVRVSPAFVGEGKRNWYRAHRGRLFLVDGGGRRQYLPSSAIVDRPRSRDGWLLLAGRPTADVPMPLGFTDDGFDPARITALGVSVEASNREGELVSGTVELRHLRVSFENPVSVRLLPSDPAVVAGEGERAARMNTRLEQRCGVGPKGMAVGVNLAWPTARAPNGEDMQLYGRLLDGGNKWWDRYWDLGEEAVQTSVRNDLREIRDTFGTAGTVPVVRMWLFTDLRAGLVFDGAGDPVAVSERAKANMPVLLRLAAEEKVVLMPSLLDFGLADGVSRSGPDGAWEVGERADLITDPVKRGKLVKVLGEFVRAFANHPAVLAWDVMNEPENAAGVVTAAHFGDLQALVRELVDAVHKAGDLATVGHRNVPDPQRFFRGRVASDLGEVHYYPFIETRSNPTPFGVRLQRSFGPLPAGWGELQLTEGKVESQLGAARRAGHRLFMFWAWRGHQDTGDGFAVRPYAEEIKKAVAKIRGDKLAEASR